jgi:hypothetical protein
LDGARVLVGETLAVGVLDRAADLVVHAVLDDVLEFVIELDAVFVAAVVLVEVVEPVVVLEDVMDAVRAEVEEDVLDTEPVRVEVIDAVVVFVLVEERVLGNVGSDDLEAVVVFVDVFDCVDDCVGTTPRFLWITVAPYSGTGTWHIAKDLAGPKEAAGGPEVSTPSKA